MERSWLTGATTGRGLDLATALYMVSGDRSSSRATTMAAMALELLEDGRERPRALLRVVWSSDVCLMIGCNCYRVQIKQMKLERVPELAYRTTRASSEQGTAAAQASGEQDAGPARTSSEPWREQQEQQPWRE